MARNLKGEIDSALAVIGTERAALARLEASVQAELAPARAAFEAAQRVVEASHGVGLREGRERLARAESALLNALLGANLNFAAGHGVEAEVKRDFVRTVQPGEFLKFAGKKNFEAALECLSVGFAKAAKAFGEDALKPITEETPKGPPKLIVRSAGQ